MQTVPPSDLAGRGLNPAERITPSRARIASVDIIRGAVMVLMALDHVRVYAGVPAGGPTPGIFFTRWVTHFCAPAFVFLAGTSAFLYGRRVDRRGLSRFLLIRGALLVILELTVIRLCWTFNLEVTTLMAGVIWAIGWSMIVLSLLVSLPIRAIAALGVATIALHNLTDGFAAQLQSGLASSPIGWLWRILYFGGPVGGADGGPALFVLYAIVPWAGVMAAGYAFGTVFLMAPDPRRRLCLAVGLGAVAVFFLLRGINGYGNPTPWSGERMPGWLSFLNPAKYPASLDFLLMTLGPTIALVPLLEPARGAVARVLTVFGRVPLFYYLLHIPLIHLLAMLVSLLRDGSVHPWLFGNHPALIGPPPDGYVWSLGFLYLVWFISVVMLYFPSRWFAERKARSRSSWLTFL